MSFYKNSKIYCYIYIKLLKLVLIFFLKMGSHQVKWKELRIFIPKEENDSVHQQNHSTFDCIFYPRS